MAVEFLLLLPFLSLQGPLPSIVLSLNNYDLYNKELEDQIKFLF